MKKFYSIIAIASLMLTSVLSFTSCQKDEMPATMAKTQSVQAQQSVVNAASQSTNNVTNTNSKSKSNSGSEYKIEDTSFVIGTWTANVNGSEYKLVVTSDVNHDLMYFDEYRATLYAGDYVLVGVFSATHLAYMGEFHTDAKDCNGSDMNHLYICNFSENNLTEFTAEKLFIGGKNVARNIRFVKQ